MSSIITDVNSGPSGSVAMKNPVRVATTVNITLSGLQTIDGVTVVADDRVLVKDQSTASENGIYIASSSAWSRAADFDGIRDVVKGTVVRVTDGTVNEDTYWGVTTSNPIIPGTDSIAFALSVNQLNGVSPFAATLLDDTSASNALSTLGFSAFAKTLIDDASASAFLATLGESFTTWTPTLSFATPGNLSVSYSTRVGLIWSFGKLRVAHCNIVTSAFTHTTASGALTVSGLTVNSNALTDAFQFGPLVWGGITKASYTGVVARLGNSSATVDFFASGSGQTPSQVVAADTPTGGTMTLRFTLPYFTD